MSYTNEYVLIRVKYQSHLFTGASVEEYKHANTDLDYGNWLRSKEIADLFSRTGFTLPDAESPAYDKALDYRDVELKIVQQEGYDGHDFNLFDDRASLLWRKPYLDGAVRELTSGEDRSPEELRRAVDQVFPSLRGTKTSRARGLDRSKHNGDLPLKDAPTLMPVFRR